MTSNCVELHSPLKTDEVQMFNYVQSSSHIITVKNRLKLNMAGGQFIYQDNFLPQNRRQL